MGEAAPQYVSFVVPVDETGRFFPAYQCETVTVHRRARSISTHELLAAGRDSFVLRVSGLEFWFIVKPVARAVRRLPYVGTLGHPDFELLFTEIEADDPAKLDRLCDEQHTFVMGCDPFTHYTGIQSGEPTSPRPSRGREGQVGTRSSTG